MSGGQKQILSTLTKVPTRLRVAFFLRVRRRATGCWPWLGYVGNPGYGVFSPGAGQRIGAHRMSWVIHRGPIPRSKYVLHKCDNRVCVRPGHLFLGTHWDNVKDCIQKGRHRGAPRKLTNAEIAQIQRDPRSQRPIARDYGVTQGYVSAIKRRVCGRKEFDYMAYRRKYMRRYYPNWREIRV
jgi:HNH endonuclease